MDFVAKLQAERRPREPPRLDLIRAVLEERGLPATLHNGKRLLDAINDTLARIEGELPIAEETDP